MDKFLLLSPVTILLNKALFVATVEIMTDVCSLMLINDFTTGVNLTNRMWFSVVCTLIDNDTHHHSGQNGVES